MFKRNIKRLKVFYSFYLSKINFILENVNSMFIQAILHNNVVNKHFEYLIHLRIVTRMHFFKITHYFSCSGLSIRFAYWTCCSSWGSVLNAWVTWLCIRFFRNFTQHNRILIFSHFQPTLSWSDRCNSRPFVIWSICVQIIFV